MEVVRDRDRRRSLMEVCERPILTQKKICRYVDCKYILFFLQLIEMTIKNAKYCIHKNISLPLQKYFFI